MHEELVETAGERGFIQYEVANFARHLPQSTGPSELPSHACRHNVNYWRGGSYFGLGPSAAGFLDGVRTKNWSNTTLYCEQMERTGRAVESMDRLSPLGRAGEIAAFGLRMNAGWPLVEFKAATGFELTREWAVEIGDLCRRGWARLDHERLQLTAAGMRFADSAGAEFLRLDTDDSRAPLEASVSA
jgi:oxygen-independent coproporphyrinogen-3 oxidase